LVCRLCAPTAIAILQVAARRLETDARRVSNSVPSHCHHAHTGSIRNHAMVMLFLALSSRALSPLRCWASTRAVVTLCITVSLMRVAGPSFGGLEMRSLTRSLPASFDD
jgi:hypothetical protein